MKTTRSVLVLSILLALGMTSVHADFVGFKIGPSYWEPELAGSILGDQPLDTPIGFVGDIGLEDIAPSNFILTLEHPVPLLPNLKYQSIELDSRGSNDPVVDPFFYGGTTLTGTMGSTFDLSHDDIVLYYEILNNWVSLDIGLDIKVFDGEVVLTHIGPTETVLIDETIPLLYLSARFDLPFSGFYIGADLNGASSDDNSIEDTSIMLGYESGTGLGIEGGIKKFSLELNDVTDINTNLEYDGIYLNGYYHF
jgi:outer membrane protein